MELRFGMRKRVGRNGMMDIGFRYWEMNGRMRRGMHYGMKRGMNHRVR